MNDFSIIIVFKGHQQRYYLYWSDLRDQFSFKWCYSTFEPENTHAYNKKEFKWFDTIRDAMIDALYEELRPGISIHKISFDHFLVNGYIVKDLTFLNFI